jgi:putative intracellular protease/amidase
MKQPMSAAAPLSRPDRSLPGALLASLPVALLVALVVALLPPRLAAAGTPAQAQAPAQAQPLRASAHNDPNPVSAQRPRRVAIVVANPTTSSSTGWPVGFWWSELTHPYFLFSERGYEVEIFSYFGGKVEGDAMSNPDDATRWQREDLISRGFRGDPDLMALLETTRPAKEIDVTRFDAIVIAGGQAPITSLEKAVDTQKKFVEFYERGKIAAALCHGVGILRYAKLSNGTYLARGKTVTGFANVEEDFADQAVWSAKILPRGKHVMAWRVEDEVKKVGANYVQAGRWKSFAVRDGNLITGQQNYSGLATAEAIIRALGE